MNSYLSINTINSFTNASRSEESGTKAAESKQISCISVQLLPDNSGNSQREIIHQAKMDTKDLEKRKCEAASADKVMNTSLVHSSINSRQLSANSSNLDNQENKSFNSVLVGDSIDSTDNEDDEFFDAASICDSTNSNDNEDDEFFDAVSICDSTNSNDNEDDEFFDAVSICDSTNSNDNEDDEFFDAEENDDLVNSKKECHENENENVITSMNEESADDSESDIFFDAPSGDSDIFFDASSGDNSQLTDFKETLDSEQHHGFYSGWFNYFRDCGQHYIQEPANKVCAWFRGESHPEPYTKNDLNSLSQAEKLSGKEGSNTVDPETSTSNKESHHDKLRKNDAGLARNLFNAGCFAVHKIAGLARPIAKHLKFTGSIAERCNRKFGLVSMIARALSVFIMHEDRDLSSAAPIVNNKAEALEAISVLAYVLGTSHDTYSKQHGENFQEIKVSSLQHSGIKFKDIKAVLKPIETGGVYIESLSFIIATPNCSESNDTTCDDNNIIITAKDLTVAPKLSATQEVEGISLPQLGADVMMKSNHAVAKEIFDQGCPEGLTISIGAVEVSASGSSIGMNEMGAVKFGMRNTTLEVKLNKEYPAVHPEIILMASEIDGEIKFDKAFPQTNLTVHMDKEHNGVIKVNSIVDGFKHENPLFWLVGKIEVLCEIAIQDGIVQLDSIIDSIKVKNCRWYNWPQKYIVKWVLKSLLRNAKSGIFYDKDTGQYVLRVKSLDDMPLPPYAGINATSEIKGKLGSIMLNECLSSALQVPTTLQSTKDEVILDELSELSSKGKVNTERYKVLVWRLMDTIVELRDANKFKAAEHLIRAFPVEGLIVMMNDIRAKKSSERVSDENNLLRLLADLTRIYPEKAVLVMEKMGSGNLFPVADFDDNFADVEYIPALIIERIAQSQKQDLTEISDDQLIQQDNELRDLLWYWTNRELSPDKDIRSLLEPERKTNMVEFVCEQVAKKIQQGILTAGALVLPEVCIPALIGQKLNEADEVINDPIPKEGLTKCIKHHEKVFHDNLENKKIDKEELVFGYDLFALLPKHQETMASSNEFSQRILRHYINLAVKTNDIRYWEMLGKFWDTGYCSIQRILSAHGGMREWAGDDQQAFLARVIEQSTEEVSTKMVDNYLNNASVVELEPMVNAFCNIQDDIKMAAEGNLDAWDNAGIKMKMQRAASLPPGEERKELFGSINSQILKDMIRSWHRTREITGIHKLLDLAEETADPEKRKAILLSIPTKRIIHQLTTARAIDSNPAIIGAQKCWLSKEHIAHLDILLKRIYQDMVVVCPDRVVPGVLSEKAELDFKQYLLDNHKCKNAQGLFKVFLAHSDVHSKMEQESKDLTYKQYQKQVLVIMATYCTSLLEGVPFGAGLILQGMAAAYAANCYPDITDCTSRLAHRLQNSLLSFKEMADRLLAGSQENSLANEEANPVASSPQGQDSTGSSNSSKSWLPNLNIIRRLISAIPAV